MKTEINSYDEICKQADETFEKFKRRLLLEVECQKIQVLEGIQQGDPYSIGLNEALGTIGGIAKALGIISEMWDSELGKIAEETKAIHSKLVDESFKIVRMAREIEDY